MKLPASDPSKYKERKAGIAFADDSGGVTGFATVRESVARFALIMNRKLDEKADKKGGRPDWLEADPFVLTNFLDLERLELEEALSNLYEARDLGLPGQEALADEVAREAADVANFGMMLADHAGRLD